jgi:hypothetical protein
LFGDKSQPFHIVFVDWPMIAPHDPLRSDADEKGALHRQVLKHHLAMPIVRINTEDYLITALQSAGLFSGFCTFHGPLNFLA